MSRHRISWSELPSELLMKISDRLGTQTDAITFRLVCKVWRDSTTFYPRNKPLNILSPLLPHKFPINELNLKKEIETDFSLTLLPCSVFIVRSLVNNQLCPWLCAIEEFTPGKFHDIGKSTLDKCPAFPYYQYKTLTPKSLNVAFFRVLELGRFYTIKCDEYPTLYAGSKVILISNPKFGTLSEIVDYKAIVLDDDGDLRMISIKHGIINRVTGPYTDIYDDVVNFQGSIFAIDRQGRLYGMAYNNVKLKIVMSKPVVEGSGSDKKNFLIVDTSKDELYLVHSYMKSIFKVYKVNFESGTWDEVAGIGVDRILVIIHKNCFFTTAKDIPGLQGNCIMFRNGDFHAYKSNNRVGKLKTDDETRLFSFQDGSCENVAGDKICNQFSPPPSWVSNDTSLFKRLSIRETMIVREFGNHVISESRCTKETCVAEAILHMNDELKDITEIKVMQRVARDHVRKRMLSPNDRMKLKRNTANLIDKR